MPHELGSPASLIVVDPSGRRSTVPVRTQPFTIGRQSDNQIVMRDNRASRVHARVTHEQGDYWIEDLNSRHGTFVNGARIQKHKLQDSDRIEFGAIDSYQLIFMPAGGQVSHLVENFPAPEKGGKMGKLKAVMEVARALQTSLSTHDVLTAVVDAALAVTGAERGFLLLSRDDELEMRVARDRAGSQLAEGDLQVPRRLIRKALRERRELLSMNFDHGEIGGVKPEHTVADLDLRSVVCVPLVRIRIGGAQDTSLLSAANETAGVLYMDSRIGAADLSAGNRELLQTLALEASTILENARLLEEERGKQKIEEELNVARQIQQSLYPRCLPAEGWFVARGSSVASLQVGGDYFDVLNVNEDCWAAAVADVSGKGVSSALLACYLQGALSAAGQNSQSPQHTMELINRFLLERAEAEKYATAFHCTLQRNGRLRYINAGHCAPLVIPRDGRIWQLETTGVPLGLVPGAKFTAVETVLLSGDRLVIYSDGVSEARGPNGDFYGLDRLREVIGRNVSAPGDKLHDAILEDVREFTRNTPQADDITLVVLGYCG
ncbi:MAG TPA: SpoIIE family protein phosphatase [Bryobacteraceae bacterium]|nr:SpoIIE family protein phosphatase [Bryobacteraceae bacterium]